MSRGISTGPPQAMQSPQAMQAMGSPEDAVAAEQVTPHTQRVRTHRPCVPPYRHLGWDQAIGAPWAMFAEAHVMAGGHGVAGGHHGIAGGPVGSPSPLAKPMQSDLQSVAA